MQRGKVEDKWDGGSMFLGKTQKNSMPRPSLPFRKFLAALKSGIENISGAPPDMEMMLILVLEDSAS